MKFYFFIFISVISMGHTLCEAGGSKKIPENPFEKLSKQTLEAKDKNDHGLEIIFSNNINGELKSCGCSLNPKGGLDRRLNFLRKEKAVFPRLILDGGNSLFPSENLDSSMASRLKENARTLMKAHDIMGVVAQNIGRLDLAAGHKFLKELEAQSKVKFISSNLLDHKNEALFSRELSLKVDNVNLKILAFISPSYKNDSYQIEAPQKVWAELSKNISQDTLVIILSDLLSDEEENLLKSISRPVIVLNSREFSSLEQPLIVKNGLVLRAQFQGQQWGRVLFHWNPSKSAWSNLSLARQYSQRWEKLVAAAQNPKVEEDKAQKLYIEDSLKSLASSRLPQGKNALYFEHQLIDMNENYDGQNELSSWMNDKK